MADCTIDCPGEVSVIGFDDFDWTQNFHPRLTTIVQPAEKLGRCGTEILIERIKMHDGTRPMSPIPAEPLLFEAELRIRESTAPARPD
jgi:DNA-binding LacI/PurR family transcriptional regulator